MRNIIDGRIFQFVLLIISIVVLFYAPKAYSFRYCVVCLVIFLLSSSTLLVNNVKVYGTFFLFEVFFTLSFFFVNYAYPVFIYEIDPYFSLFTRAFNEQIISKCTAIATIGFVAYSIGQYKDGNSPTPAKTRKGFVLTPLNGKDIFILSFLFGLFIYASISALMQGYSQSGSVGSGFFFLFSLFYIYKFYAHSQGKTSKFCIYTFFSLLTAYIIISLILGNRGEPLYLCMAIVYCHYTYVKRISGKKLIIIFLAGLFIFYFIGKTRISYNQLGILSRSERIAELQAEDNYLRYANELIINNRSSFVLVDYADKNGYTYGKTWSSNFFSMIPFGQSFAINILNIPKHEFSTTYLTTWLEFRDNDPDAFGMGTNLIGDIYVSFGVLGVLTLMYIFGFIVRRVHDRSIQSYSYYQMFYVILIALSVYYTRSTLFSPMQMLSWTLVLCLLSKRKPLKIKKNG